MHLTKKQKSEVVKLLSDDLKIWENESEFLEYCEFLGIDSCVSKRLFSEFECIHPFEAQNMSIDDWSDIVEYVTTNKTAVCY